ncbi:retrovirus-related pol polyprotein from transposon TNT 1-94, partial [Tanacetum coccineum]
LEDVLVAGNRLSRESLLKGDYFDKVVKKRLTSDAITTGSWGFELTKECLVTEIISFLKVLKDTFNAFDKTLLDEITKVQTIFNQMEAAVAQCSVDKNVFEIQIKQLRIDNVILNQIIKCLELEIELFKKKDFIEKEAYDKISQEKDTVNRKLKERIKSLSGKDSVGNVKKDIDEIETINIELEHSVAKLLSENENLRKEREHLKSIYKDQFDSIRKTRVLSKEHCDSLIAYINAKSVENLDLDAQLQEKVFAITALKNELRKLKGKNVVNTVVSKPNATIAPGMFNLDIKPISPRLKNNRDAHEVYIEKTIEYTDTLRGFVERARTQYPSEPLLEFACMFTKHVQELLVYASQTCPNSPKPSEKLVSVTPINKDKRVRFTEPVTSLNNIPKQTDSLKTKDSNKPLLPSTRVTPTTSASGSKPSSNTKNNRIMQPPRSNQKNKVEDHHRKVKSSLNKTNSISEPISNALVKHSGLRHNLFSVGQFYDADLEVAFRKNTCFIPNLEGVDLLSGSRDTNLYIISLDDMLKTSLICLLSKASKTKSWLWHRRLSHLNFGTLNKLAKDRSCTRSKDEAPDAIIKCIKSIQVCLNATVRNVRTDNGTEFVNQTLHDIMKCLAIYRINFCCSRTAFNRTTFVERTKTNTVKLPLDMLIFLKVPLFLWAEAINTACYTQNCSLIRLRYNKNPYELMHDKKPDLSFFHVFGSLCYPTNDSEDLGKLNAKADIGIFVGYVPTKKAFRIYNRRTRKIMETIHVTFDELTSMASEQFGSGLRLQVMTPATSSSGLVPNIIPQQPFPVAAAPRAVDIADSPVSMSIDQDSPSSSILSTQD